jgi:chorismate synthase
MGAPRLRLLAVVCLLAVCTVCTRTTVIVVSTAPSTPASASPSASGSPSTLNYCYFASPGVHAVIQTIKDAKLEGLKEQLDSVGTEVRAIRDASPIGTQESVILSTIAVDLAKMRLDLLAAPAISGLTALLKADADLQSASALADTTFGC